MLRYKTETRPGLVALYDIRPGNGAGLFLQPWSPHGATGAISCANHHHQQTNIQFFYRPDALPVTQPTVSKHLRENNTLHGLAYPKLTQESSNSVSDH